jgi:hypothetical protein
MWGSTVTRSKQWLAVTISQCVYVCMYVCKLLNVDKCAICAGLQQNTCIHVIQNTYIYTHTESTCMNTM